MERRKFIGASAAVVSLAAGKIAWAGTSAFEGAKATVGTAPVAAPTPARFVLGYHNGLANGFWMDASTRPFENPSAKVKVFMLGVQASSSSAAGNPLRRFDVDMLYRIGTIGRATAPYRWVSLSRSSGLSKSKAITHTLLPDQISGLNVGYDYTSGATTKRETLSLPWVTTTAPLMTPGFYALVGPSAATGLPPSWSAIAAPVAASCLVGRCDGRSPDFDALLIAVEPA